MSDKKGKTTLMILLTALGALAIIILFGWVAFFNPAENLNDKPQLSLSSLSEGEEKSLLPEKSAEELLLDGLQKGEETPLLIEDTSDNIIITIEDSTKEEPIKDLSVTEDIKSEPPVVVKPEPVKYKDITEDIHWIQVGSFPNSAKADNLRETLKEKGINTVIQTKNINGTLYYRVRVGAYTNRNEAASFKEKLLTLDNINDAPIFTESVTRSVPVY